MTSQSLDDKEEVNPPYGHKGGFRKITMTLPPVTYERLVLESSRRRAMYEPHHLLSALLREALDEFFTSDTRQQEDAAGLADSGRGDLAL